VDGFDGDTPVVETPILALLDDDRWSRPGYGDRNHQVDDRTAPQRATSLRALERRPRITRYAAIRHVTSDATTQSMSVSVKSCGVS
jgi:hypothetical protein